MPFWQAQMLVDELIADGIPAVMTEDFGVTVSMYNRETMARIFVTEDRKAEAEALIDRDHRHPPGPPQLLTSNPPRPVIPRLRQDLLRRSHVSSSQTWISGRAAAVTHVRACTTNSSRSPRDRKGCSSAAQTPVAVDLTPGSSADSSASGWLEPRRAAGVRDPRSARDAPLPPAARAAVPRRAELGELRGRGVAARARPVEAGRRGVHGRPEPAGLSICRSPCTPPT